MQEVQIQPLALPHDFCVILNLCAINTRLSVGALTSLRFNQTVEVEILELSPYQASVGLPRLISLGPMPGRGSCTAFPASLGLPAV